MNIHELTFTNTLWLCLSSKGPHKEISTLSRTTVFLRFIFSAQIKARCQPIGHSNSLRHCYIHVLWNSWLFVYLSADKPHCWEMEIIDRIFEGRWVSCWSQSNAATKEQKNVSGLSSTANTAEYSKNREKKSVHACRMWAKQKLDHFHGSVNPLCDTKWQNPLCEKKRWQGIIIFISSSCSWRANSFN